MNTATSSPPSPEGSIDCSVRGPVLLIAINRPAKRNGFTPRMFRELGEAYTRLDDDPALRVGVLHALGDHFTAGLDLPTIAPLMQRGEKAVPLGLVDPLDQGTLCLTPAMRVRIHNGMICLPTRRVVCPKAHARGLVRKAPVLVRTRRGVVLRASRFVTKPGKASSLALGFAPHGSSRKSPAAHRGSQAEGPNMEGYRRRSKPMVVAVHGITYTLGIELMLAADIVVAADDCRFSQLEVKRGIMATGGATLRMAERAGLGNALLHLLTGDEFGSAEALRLNFVQKVVPAGQLLDEALRIADAISAQAPLAVIATRNNALKAVEQGPVVAMQEFMAVQQRLSRSEDAAEGVRSFVEKRPAKFQGR